MNPPASIDTHKGEVVSPCAVGHTTSNRMAEARAPCTTMIFIDDGPKNRRKLRSKMITSKAEHPAMKNVTRIPTVDAEKCSRPYD